VDAIRYLLWRMPARAAHGCLFAAFALACAGCSTSSAGGTGADASTSGEGASGDAGTSTDAGHDATSADAPSGDSPSSGGGDGSTGDGGSPTADSGVPDPLGPVPDGGLFVQFATADEQAAFDPAQEEKSTGTITFGATNTGASDSIVANLTRTGGQTAIGTAGAVEIVSNRTFSFGTFRFRLSFASCASTEDVVNGPFAYFNDGTKAADGLVINREVDIEILCGEPWLINLTIWTEYTDDTHLVNQSRVVDTKAGKVYVYADDQEGNETSTEDHPELLLPGWPATGAFYELGWTWATDHLRYFMNVGGTYVTLWDATDATRIPQAPMAQHFNIWAPGISWSTGKAASPPANDATLALDWFRYDPQ
jgi:hypothetical protein